MKHYADIIKRPIITEKTAMMSAERKFVFEVAADANKTAIKQAVEMLFDGVKVANVNTINSKPNARRVGRHLGKTAAFRKAIITLTADSKEIELF